jgi:hypothetical protein
MLGANAPASIWRMTFDHANLSPASYFALVFGNSPFNGQAVKQNKGTAGGGNVIGLSRAAVAHDCRLRRLIPKSGDQGTESRLTRHGTRWFRRPMLGTSATRPSP